MPFKDIIRLIWNIMEVNIDDMVVKCRKSDEGVPNLVEVFEILKRHKLCLNANKCAFGVGSSKFLGYMTTI